MLRKVYTGLWWLALPWLPLRLWWRGRREPGYRANIGERFGRYAAPAAATDVLWLHAVSLGETRAAAPLVAKLLRERPAATLLLTHMTATGREAGAAFNDSRVVQAWLPYDIPFAIEAFLAHWKPRIGMLMETEVWPNLVAACASSGIPLFLVNARLSERSLRGYRRLPSLTRPMFAALAGVAAQTPADAARLRDAGTRDVTVTGNLKFDVSISDDLRTRGKSMRDVFGADRPTFLAAATRDGEEALLLDALARTPLPDEALTVIVPRHPQRFDEVAELMRARGLRFVRRSEGANVPANVAFVLGDTMGELVAYYLAADVAFVGGSLLPLGGQNLIEAIAAGVPTIVGVHTFNFAEAAAQAVAANAAVRASDAGAVVAAAIEILQDPPRASRMRQAGLAFHAAHRGAVDRLWAWLEPRLSRSAGG